MSRKQVIGAPLVIDGRELSLSRAIRAGAGCELGDVVKSMVWLKRREDFPGFNAVYAEYFAEQPPTRSALISDFLIDILVEIECVAYRPL